MFKPETSSHRHLVFAVLFTLKSTPSLAICHDQSVAYRGILFGGRVQQIQLRTEDREDGDLGTVAPTQGLWRQL